MRKLSGTAVTLTPLTLGASTSQGTTMPELTLVQDGTKLSASYSSATLGDSEVYGMVDGNNITISFEADLQGQSAPVMYKGTVDGDGVWSGTIDIAGGKLSGTLTGTKKQRNKENKPVSISRIGFYRQLGGPTSRLA